MNINYAICVQIVNDCGAASCDYGDVRPSEYSLFRSRARQAQAQAQAQGRPPERAPLLPLPPQVQVLGPPQPRLLDFLPDQPVGGPRMGMGR
jgi:hypothetical protein